MSSLPLINDNIKALIAGSNIIQLLNSEQYKKVESPYFSASIGKHFRHILDHYLSFISGLPENHINYDRRDRDSRIETDISYASTTIDQIILALEGIRQHPPRQDNIKISLCTRTDSDHTAPVTSSIQRELVFLQGHTTHHYAIIATMLKFAQIPVDQQFGVAPSTLKYEEYSQCVQ